MNSQMMKRARQLQKEMVDAQNEIEQTEFKINCGPISIVMLGDRTITEVHIDPDFQIESREDAEILEDAIVAANRGLLEEIQLFTEEKMGKFKQFLGGF